MTKKLTKEEKDKRIQQMSANLVSYFNYVISKLTGSNDEIQNTLYIETHRITTRIVEKDGESYFSIFKGKKLIDQNNTRIFI